MRKRVSALVVAGLISSQTLTPAITTFANEVETKKGSEQNLSSKSIVKEARYAERKQKWIGNNLLTVDFERLDDQYRDICFLEQPDGSVRLSFLPYSAKATLKYSNGKIVQLSDRSIVRPDGTILLWDKYHVDVKSAEIAIKPDGITIVKGADGKFNSKDDIKIIPGGKGFATSVDGTASIVFPEGIKAVSGYPYSHVELLYKGQININGKTIEAPKGTIVQTDGKITLPDGTIVKPGGEMIKPDGTVVKPDGTIVKPGGEVIKPDGTVV
ncbi:TPA: hypothetical protein ACOTHR_003191, partial [Clostridium perfringens]